MAAAIRNELAPDGLMVFQLTGVAAGQTVFRYHMHLMPRPERAAPAAHARARPTRVPGRVALYAALLGLALSVCAGPGSDPAHAAWTREWNARLDAATSDLEHPCATKSFIAWADGFLAGCEEDAAAAAPDPDCAARNGWVRERVEQCREWTAWQLRNFGRHERVEGEAPSMRIR